MNTFVPHDEWWAGLPKKVVSAGVLFFDEKARILIVKPTYKDHWQLPGGIIEAHESPANGALREVQEEIGLRIQTLQFLGVAHTPLDLLRFIFFGGSLAESQISEIHIDGDEIVDFKFVEQSEALALVGEVLRQCLPQCIEAASKGTAQYIEIKPNEISVEYKSG